MTERGLARCRILVVEDEWLIADELRAELDDAGAIVLGPAGTIEDALDLIRSEQPIDAAVLDINLGGEPIFPAADLLVGRNVPFVFTTGYDQAAIPERFRDVVRCEKPVNIVRITQAIGRALRG